MQRDTYSRFVFWAKLVLPFTALALLSMLFFVARHRSGNDLPFAFLREFAAEQRVNAPHVSGVTSDGTAYDLIAEQVRLDPDNIDRVLGKDMMATLDFLTGNTMNVSAGAFAINTKAEKIFLTRLARVTDANGYHAETAALDIDLLAGTMQSRDMVEMRWPFGVLTAGGMLLTQRAATSDQDEIDEMYFHKGVKLVYTPKKEVDP